MSLLKQIILSAVILGAAVAGWYTYQNPQLLSMARETEGAPGAGPAGAGRNLGRIPGLSGPGGAVNVVAAPVETDDTGELVTALGTAKASRSVMIVPQVTGIVAEVAFRPGTPVNEGDVLVRLDDAEQRVAVDRATVALKQAQDALDRARQLADSRTISTVALSDAETAVQVAEIELRTAEIELSRRTLSAPFNGVTGLTDISVGDLVTTSTEIVSLDDLSTVLVGFEVPERRVGQIAPGTSIVATAKGLPGSEFRGEVTATDSRVDESTRTLRVEASLANEDQVLKPGMAVTVTLEFGGEERLSVPALAVQWDSEGSFVWKVDGDVARRADVVILRRQSGAVVVNGELQAGDRVVVEGVQRLRDGANVALVGDETSNQQAEPEPSADSPNAITSQARS